MNQDYAAAPTHTLISLDGRGAVTRPSNPAVELISVECPDCLGDGEYEIEACYWTLCYRCDGLGHVMMCAACYGTGQVEIEHGRGYDYDNCPVCLGRGS